MKNTLKYISFAVAALLGGAAMVSCGGNIDPEGSGEASLTLEVFPEGIVADGVTAATFTVRYKGEDVTNDAQILCVTSNETLSSNEFTTVAAGVYEFKASYNLKVSNTVEVTALALGEGVRVVLSKEQIEANGRDVTSLILLDKDNNVLNQDDQTLVAYNI